MKPKEIAHYALIMSPLFMGLVAGYTVQISLTNIQILYFGLPLLAGALLFSTLAYRITKYVVAKYGIDKEVNPIARDSFKRGTASKDHRNLWLGLLAVASVEYFLAPHVWLFLLTGGFGAMFLDWLNDFLALLRKKKADSSGTKLA